MQEERSHWGRLVSALAGQSWAMQRWAAAVLIFVGVGLFQAKTKIKIKVKLPIYTNLLNWFHQVSAKSRSTIFSIASLLTPWQSFLSNAKQMHPCNFANVGSWKEKIVNTVICCWTQFILHRNMFLNSHVQQHRISFVVNNAHQSFDIPVPLWAWMFLLNGPEHRVLALFCQ